MLEALTTGLIIIAVFTIVTLVLTLVIIAGFKVFSGDTPNGAGEFFAFWGAVSVATFILTIAALCVGGLVVLLS